MSQVQKSIFKERITWKKKNLPELVCQKQGSVQKILLAALDVQTDQRDGCHHQAMEAAVEALSRNIREGRWKLVAMPTVKFSWSWVLTVVWWSPMSSQKMRTTVT